MPAVRRPGGTGTTVEELRDAAALRELIPEWEALAADAAEANPFYEHWMLLPALRAFGEGDGFRCAAVWQDGTLGALFPDAACSSVSMACRSARCAAWSHRNMLHCTPLIRGKGGSQNAVKCVTALLQSRLARRLTDFDWTCTDGYVLRRAGRERAHPRPMPWMVTDAYMRPALVRGRDPRARFNSNTRNNLRR